MVTAHVTCAGRQGQRQSAKDKRQRGHDDRPEAQLSGGNRRFANRFTQLFTLQLGKLDDQDGILRRQTDDHQHADLNVDTGIQTAQHNATDTAKESKGRCGKYRQRQRPALVLRR